MEYARSKYVRLSLQFVTFAAGVALALGFLAILVGMIEYSTKHPESILTINSITGWSQAETIGWGGTTAVASLVVFLVVWITRILLKAPWRLAGIAFFSTGLTGGLGLLYLAL